MVLSIKNMVCNRCIMSVEQILKNNNITDFEVSMGKVNFYGDNIDNLLLEKITREFSNIGFEVLEDKKSKVIDSIKTVIISKIHHQEFDSKQFNWSILLSTELNYEYKYLSKLFSSVEGITIEQYIINQKIEKIKELIVYNELSISEIAWKLGYSSVAYMSNQFYKATGMRPKEFKNIGIDTRKPLDEV